ncbi:MAG: T9SS type A sorting domain-containing protein [Ignavibacteria bacterium]|jgi:hypothetical protein
MKKILTLTILLIFLVNFAPAQNKVTFSLKNKKISGGILAYTVYATVPVGQTWRVGSSNIRVTFTGNPTGCLSVHPDNPADSANTNISGANGYQAMTTTSVGGGVAIGLNILTFNTSGFHTFVGSTTPYRIGRIRFNITTPFYSDTMHFRNSPTQFPTVVYDSLVQLVYNTSYQTGDPLITGVEGFSTQLPKEFQLYQNYPNPFNPVTSIKFDIPNSSFVTMKIYDVLGKQIADIVNQDMEPGRYEVNWDGTNLASGIYFYRIEAKDFTKVMKMVLIK